VAGEGLRLYRRPRRNPSSPQSKLSAHRLENGAIAQLGERFNGIEEVVGSIPSGSTILVRLLNRLDTISLWAIIGRPAHRYRDELALPRPRRTEARCRRGKPRACCKSSNGALIQKDLAAGDSQQAPVKR
jgi:hypothetical protein